MKNRKDANNHGAVPTGETPCEIGGIGSLVSAIWKVTDASDPFRFNIFRMESSTGVVEQLYVPSDILDLVGLVLGLARYMSEQECLDPELSDDLACLASCLEDLLAGHKPFPASRMNH